MSEFECPPLPPELNAFSDRLLHIIRTPEAGNRRRRANKLARLAIKKLQRRNKDWPAGFASTWSGTSSNTFAKNTANQK